jgi:hypothetical protein
VLPLSQLRGWNSQTTKPTSLHENRYDYCLIGGLLLLIGRFVPLGLTILGAIIVNIWAFHLLMAPEPAGMAPAFVVSLLELFLLWRYREAFREIVRP